MRKKKLYIATVPAVSNDFAQSLSRRFPKREVKPGVTLEDLQYNAGQRSVIDFVLAHASGTVISGDVADLREDERNQSLLQKLLGITR